GRSQGAGLGNAALRAVGGGGKWRAGQSKARCVNWRSPTSFPVRGGMRGAPRRDSHRRKFARLSAFEPSVPLRKRRPWREAPRRTIIVSRGDLCLMTPSNLSVRRPPSATAERPFARAGPMVRIRFPPAKRCYGAGDKEMAPSSLRIKLMERLMPQPNDLSRSLAALDHDSTIIAVVEMSQSSWLVGGMLPGIERQPRKKLEPSPERLLALRQSWARGGGQGWPVHRPDIGVRSEVHATADLSGPKQCSQHIQKDRCRTCGVPSTRRAGISCPLLLSHITKITAGSCRRG